MRLFNKRQLRWQCRSADPSRRFVRVRSRPVLERLEERIVLANYHPVFSGLSSPTNVYGTTPTILSGSIADGVNIPVGDNVKITLDGTTHTVQVQNNGSFSSSFNTKALGVDSSPYTINYQFNAQSGYTATSGTGTLTVTPLMLTATINASNKVYDSTTSATVTPSLSGVINGDSVSLVNGTATFASQNVGTWTVTDTGFTLTGADADNYTVNSSATDTANITPEPLTITAVTNSKTYDATTSASTLPTITSGSLQGSDTPDFIETYGSKNVNPNAKLTPSGVVDDGNGGNNYSYKFVAITTGVISQEALTITAEPNTKSYDGTNSAATAPIITSGSLQGSDTDNFVETYESTNVGTNLKLTVNGRCFDGNDGDNYIYTFITMKTGTITDAALTVTAVVSPTDIGHGDTIPTPTFTYSGFVDGQTESIVTGTPGTTGLPTSSSPAGVYTITPTLGTLSAPNYSFTTFDPATLNIHPVVSDILVEWGSQSMSLLTLSRDLPFSTIKDFEVEFSDDVNISGTGLTLTSTASGPTYTPSLVGSDSSVTSATWSLPTAIGADRLMLALETMDITSVSGALSLYGTTSKAFNVLPGDFNGDGVVSAADMTGVNNEVSQAYDVWADINGDDTVDINDVKIVRAKIGTVLPPA